MEEDKEYQITWMEDGKKKTRRAHQNTFIAAKRQAKAMAAQGKTDVKVRYKLDGQLVHEWAAATAQFYRESRLTKESILALLEWADGKSTAKKDKVATALHKLLTSTRSDVPITKAMIRAMIEQNGNGG